VVEISKDEFRKKIDIIPAYNAIIVVVKALYKGITHVLSDKSHKEKQ
jgi:hypothetical protein